MKYSPLHHYIFKCASCSLCLMLLSAINLPFYDPQVTIHYHQIVNFLFHCYNFTNYALEEEYTFWGHLPQKIYCLRLPPLQFDHTGYLWAVGHLFCVGKSKNMQRCYA